MGEVTIIDKDGSTPAQIMALQAMMLAAEGTTTDFDDVTTHHWAPGCYGREIFMAEGTVVVGKIHKHAHLNILLQGEVTVSTEFGNERFSAPRVWVSEPGTKRAVYNHTDTRWMTIHPTDETDLEVIEEHDIAPTYEDYTLFVEETKRLSGPEPQENTICHGEQ